MVLVCSADRASRYSYAIKTNLMHCLSSVYFFSQPVHISGISVVQQQGVQSDTKKKRELLKNPTKIEEIQGNNVLTEIEPLQLAF